MLTVEKINIFAIKVSHKPFQRLPGMGTASPELVIMFKKVRNGIFL